MQRHARSIVAGLTDLLLAVSLVSGGQTSGELKVWHKVTITFDGPQTSERAEPNPFTDYRLMVAFTKGQKTSIVPGYYAADGNAAHTGADSGNKWRVHFAPCEPGQWSYRVSFKKGPGIALNDDPGTGPGQMDGETGSFVVGPSDKTGPDLRGKGRLQYVGEHYLRFAGTGEYFLKAGPDAPETFLAYADFDGTEAHRRPIRRRTGWL